MAEELRAYATARGRAMPGLRGYKNAAHEAVERAWEAGRRGGAMAFECWLLAAQDTLASTPPALQALAEFREGEVDG